MKKSIFALFDNYVDAETAIDNLVEHDFSEEQMNVLVREQLAKERMDVNLHKVDVKKTDEVGNVTVRGLPKLLGGEQAVHLPGVGNVLAAGDTATIMARSAAASGAAAEGLREALVEMNVPEAQALSFRDEIDKGGILFWIRTDEERAPAAASVLREEKGRFVADYAGNEPLG